MSNSILKTDDIILSKVGNSIGYFSRVSEKIGECNISENNIGIKLRQQSKYRKHYILAYLNSSYAQALVLRRRSGNAQPKLNVKDLTYIPIPIFSEKFEKTISNIIIEANRSLNLSLSFYVQAEKILMYHIGLGAMVKSESSIAIKSFKQTYRLSKRLDAEYFNPRYDELFLRLKNCTFSRLSGIVQINKSIEPGSEAYQNHGTPFIRVANLSKFGISETHIYLSAKDYKDVIRPKQDTILLSKDGSVGIAYKVDECLDVITSGAILHLNVTDNEFMPDYLTLVLNSPIVRMQAERDAGGSIIQHWKPSEIENVIIPKLSKDIQSEISNKVRGSFALRKESQRLLEIAKRAVEIAIEQGEDCANMTLVEELL